MSWSSSSKDLAPEPFIYINGYPGIAKLTIARELNSLIEYSKIMTSQFLIDAAAATYPDRDSLEYHSMRKSIRELQLTNAIKALPQTTCIFTDSSSEDSKTALDYQAAAVSRGSRFFSIVLTCGVEENFLRLTGEGRGGCLNTKLTDIEGLCQIRETETIFRFGDEDEMVLDVTNLTPANAALMIFVHICTSLPSTD